MKRGEESSPQNSPSLHDSLEEDPDYKTYFNNLMSSEKKERPNVREALKDFIHYKLDTRNDADKRNQPFDFEKFNSYHDKSANPLEKSKKP
mmetsp:Transcript_35781/g.54829  ORF Transcript_35781/g.54829 Transcript_35781/m.54829 type:complete len:91 (+) Transcript_35781:82-354(+)